MFAPFDRDTRATAFAHRGARPQARDVPDWLVPLGGTLGWPSNGAVTNLSYGPHAVATMRRELRAFSPDVVHLHEPVTPVVGWDALSSTDAPLVGTFHCYSESRLPHLIANTMGARRKLNRLNLRLAVSEAAAWTGRRFYGGHYRVIPNGVLLPAGGVPAPRRRAPGRAAADRVRRPDRRAQGPARAAARVRGAAPSGPRRADDRRRHAATRSSRCSSTAPA